MRRRLGLMALSAMLLAGLGVDRTARAEVVRLKNGRMLQGEIDPAGTTDETFAITRYRDGAVLRVKWDHVLDRDKRRLREALGLDVLEGAETLVPAHELVLKNGDTVQGLLLDPPPEGADPRCYYVQSAESGGKPLPFPKALVEAVHEVDLPVLQVYTVEQAYQRKLDEVRGSRSDDDLTGQEHATIADYCYKLGLYVQAKDHYERVLADESYPERTAVQNKLRNLDVLVQAAEAGADFREIQRLQFVKRFKEALDIVAEFRKKYGALTQVVALYRLDQVEKRLQVALKQQRIERISGEWFRILARKIADFMRDKDRSIKDAMTFAEKDLTNQIVTELAGKLELQPQEVLDLWKQRKAKPRTTTYGYGSFAAPEEVARAKARAQDAAKQSRDQIRQRLADAARRRQNQQTGKEKKPKTADEWWKDAPGSSKRNWSTAYYVEHGPAGFEILRVYYEPCGQCAGKGYKLVNIAQAGAGEDSQEKVRCETCNGHGLVRMVRFR